MSASEELETNRQLIGPRHGTTPVSVPKKARRALPDDLLREASHRLGITSLLMAGLWTAAEALRHLTMAMQPGVLPTARVLGVLDFVVAAIVAASLALFFYTRTGNRDPRFVLDLGLAYLVLTAFDIAVIINWEPVPPGTSVAPMISPIGPIMLMFAALVPNTPAKTLVASVIAVSMNPLSMFVAKMRGSWDFGPASNALLMHAPDYLLVPVAVAIAHVVTKLGEHVATAREMGSYQLGELLGRGGMGEVYMATHRMLARPAAIKLIRPEMIHEGGEGAETAIKRFRREAQVAASLRSPHTVELYDFGVTEDQTFYLVMELLDGMDLESLIRKEGPLPAGRVVSILRQVCESLEEAHVSGVVHRDVKPANIHLGRLGLRHDFVKVLDFGLAKSAVTSSDVTQPLATVAGLAMGTPAYMAPEMALGQTIDGQADVYALGCVAYYLLTGHLPFDGSTALQMLVKRIHDDPLPLSDRSELPIPPDLERLVMACLARNPESRPTAADLSRSLAALPIEPWTEDDAAKWWAARQP